MLSIFYGKDDFSAHEAFEALRDELDTDGSLADNTNRVDGKAARPDELLALCRTVPFLSARRLVVVEGLLSRFEGGGRRPRRGQARRRRAGTEDGGLGPWQEFVDGLEHLPETTALVLLDGEVSPNNPLLKALRPSSAKVREFEPLRKQADLADWINGRASRYGVSLEGRAVALLAALVGGNLWILDSELQKLATYAGDRRVTEEDVRSLVSLAREASVFALMDAVAEGRSRDAANLLQRLLTEGEPPQRLLVMLALQYRRLLLTKELLGSGVRPAEMGPKLGVQPFVAQRLLQQAPAYTVERLGRAYRRLLEADLSVKRGVYDDETALQLLVVELAALAMGSRRSPATRPAGRRGYGRPRSGRGPLSPGAAGAQSGKR